MGERGRCDEEEKEKDRAAKRETRSSLGSAIGSALRTGSPADSGASSTTDPTGAGAGEEGVRLRLEAIGVHVGGNIAERYVYVYVLLALSYFFLAMAIDIEDAGVDLDGSRPNTNSFKLVGQSPA